MTNDDPDGPWAFDEPWDVTHPDHPLVDYVTAVVAEQATVELILLRSPGLLGDGLADLHVTASLLAQLRAWIPLSIAAARDQGHSWEAIARQLEISPATARRRYRDHLSVDLPADLD